ncbi:hypothetical protein SprV_0100470900 [Sparganum proliferum]
MPRRARAKRRKLAASPPSLGAKIVTEDIAVNFIQHFVAFTLIHSDYRLFREHLYYGSANIAGAYPSI